MSKPDISPALHAKRLNCHSTSESVEQLFYHF